MSLSTRAGITKADIKDSLTKTLSYDQQATNTTTPYPPSTNRYEAAIQMLPCTPRPDAAIGRRSSIHCTTNGSNSLRGRRASRQQHAQSSHGRLHGRREDEYARNVGLPSLTAQLLYAAPRGARGHYTGVQQRLCGSEGARDSQFPDSHTSEKCADEADEGAWVWRSVQVQSQLQGGQSCPGVYA